MANVAMMTTGYFYADGGAMFGAIPKSAWNRRYPSDEDNGCVLSMRSLLITTSCGRKIIVDTGAGFKHLKQLAYYRFFGLKDLCEELKKRHVSPDEITDVVLTHLHFDHCGYCTYGEMGEWKLTFPNATHWVSQRQWENYCRPNALEEESFFAEDMGPVEQQGKLRLLHADEQLTDEVHLSIFDGHTPGQIVPYIQTAGETVVFAGDVIPLIASVSPTWISAYDIEPLRSYESKVHLLEQAVKEKQRLVYCHDAYSSSSLVQKTESGLFLPVRSSIVKHFL